MIEFNGYLTGTSQKFFCKQIVKLQQKFMAVAFIVGFIILYMAFYFLFNIIVEPIAVILTIIL